MYRYESHAFYASREDYEASGHSHAHGDGCGCTSCRDGRDDEGRSPDTGRWDIDGWKPLNSAIRADATDGWSGTVLTDDLIRFDKVDGWNQSVAPRQTTPEADNTGGHGDGCACPSCAEVRGEQEFVLNGKRWEVDPVVHQVGSTVTWSMATSNYAADFIQFSSFITNQQFIGVIRAAFDAWEAVTNVNFVEVTDSSNVDIRLGFGQLGGPSGTLGIANYSFSVPSNILVESFIRFDIAETWHYSITPQTDDISAYLVALHEIGHVLGIDHSDVGEAVMTASINEDLPGLTQDDIDAVQAIYGARTVNTPTNQAPTDIALSASSVTENAAAGMQIGVLSTTDPDAGDNHSYQILPAQSGAGVGNFAISGDRLVLANNASIDFEGQTSFSIAIRATDGDGASVDETFTINVTNVPISDIAVTSGGSVTENASAGTTVASFQAREGTVNQSATFSLVNDAGGLFVLNGNTLRVANGADIDYETATSHTVRLSASDGSGGTYQEDFVVAVTNMAISDIALVSGGSVAENATTGTTVATFEASENPVEPTAQFALLNDAGGRFVLDGNALKVASGASFDDQVAGSHTVRISATDGTGAARVEDFTISVTNTDIPISDITVTSGGTVTENAGQGTSVAQFGITGGAPSATLSLVNDGGGLFVLDGNTLRVAAGADIDFETATSHTLRVSASDGSGPAYQEDVTIQVGNVAVSDIVLVSGGTVTENAAGGTSVATFQAREGTVSQNATFSLANDAGGLFVLDGNTLKVASGAALDFETATSHTVRLSASDGSGGSYQESFVVAVTNMAISDIALTSGGIVSENATTGTTVATFTASEDSVEPTAQFTLLNNAGGRFVLDGNALKVATGASFDDQVAGSHTVRISATDGTGPARIEDFTIAVSNADAPISDITLTSGGTVTENAGQGTSVAQFGITGGSAAKTLTLANDAGGLFVLDGNTLRVAAGADIDFETATSHTVRVSASDGSGPAYQEDITIQVANMAISDIALVSGGTVAEDATVGATVATFEASENPVEPTAQFTLVDDAGGRFVLDGGALKVATGASFDDQLAASHTVRVSATDGTGPARVEDFTIAVSNADAPISDITVTSGGTVGENATPGTSVAQFGITGGSSAKTLSLVNNAGGRFVLDGSVLKVAAGAALDFETATSHTVRLSASDGTGSPYLEDITIQVGNVAISDIAMIDGGTVREDASSGAVVADFLAFEGGVSEDDVTFAIVSGAGGNFIIDGDQLKVSTSANLNADTQSTYQVRVSATDGTGAAYQETFTINIEDVAAPPGGPIFGTPQADTNLQGTPGTEDIFALAGDDVILWSLGNDAIDGGAGNDTAKYSLQRFNITQELNADGSITVDTPGGYTQTLTNIERIDLFDGDYVYDITSDNLGFGYRIYQAAFGRTPDEGGVRFWIDVLDVLDVRRFTENEKQQFVAEEFNKSAEFQQLYGANPNNFDYIDAMYENVLGRLPDQGGYDFWVGSMNSGVSREDVLVYFAESPENVANNIANLDDGVWVV